MSLRYPKIVVFVAPLVDGGAATGEGDEQTFALSDYEAIGGWIADNAERIDGEKVVGLDVTVTFAS